MRVNKTKVDRLDSLPVPENITLKYQAIPSAIVSIVEKWQRSFKSVFGRSRIVAGTTSLSAQITPTYVQIERLAYLYYLITLEREVLEHLSQKRPPRMATFSFDRGVVAPLFTEATKCREPTVRRKALGLLQQYSRREGIWDSCVAFGVATWFMNKEEERMMGNYIPRTS
jgi:hypothetical protein